MYPSTSVLNILMPKPIWSALNNSIPFESLIAISSKVTFGLSKLISESVPRY